MEKGKGMKIDGKGWRGLDCSMKLRGGVDDRVSNVFFTALQTAFNSLQCYASITSIVKLANVFISKIREIRANDLREPSTERNISCT